MVLSFVPRVKVGADLQPSPVHCSPTTSWRAAQIGGHPPTVEVARLRNNALFADIAGNRQPGVERHMAGKMCEAGRGGLIGPSRAAHDPADDGDIEILGLTLPLAEVAIVDWDQIGADVGALEVLGRRMVCFEDAQPTGRLGENRSASMIRSCCGTSSSRSVRG